MAKKHPGYYLILLITIQILLVFSLNLLAKGETLPPSNPLTFPVALTWWMPTGMEPGPFGLLSTVTRRGSA